MGETARVEAWRGLTGWVCGDGWKSKLGGSTWELDSLCQTEQLRFDPQGSRQPWRHLTRERDTCGCRCCRILLGSVLPLDPRKWSREPKEALKEKELDPRLLSLSSAHGFARGA
jgi:hypothetical protein